MTTTDPPQEWYRDQYMVSTSQTLLQPAAVNAAFASPALYWTHGLDDSLMKRMLSNSLCFGVYLLPQSSSEIAGSTVSFISVSQSIYHFVLYKRIIFHPL